MYIKLKLFNINRRNNSHTHTHTLTDRRDIVIHIYTPRDGKTNNTQKDVQTDTHTHTHTYNIYLVYFPNVLPANECHLKTLSSIVCVIG